MPTRSFPLTQTAALSVAAVAAACGSDGSDVQQSDLSCEVRPSETLRARIEPLLVDDNVSSESANNARGRRLKLLAINFTIDP
jgi:hypothetical protein